MSAADLTLDQIEQRAAAFLLRRDEPEWGERDEAELEAWLGQSTAHEVAYLRLQAGWRKADRLAALQPQPQPQPQPRPAARPARRARFGLRAARPWAMAASLAMVVAVGSLFAVQNGMLGGRTYVTAVGGRQTVPLADGTKVELNTDTKMRARVSPTARAVWLDRGEAYFEVRHDPAHPFVVYAGDRKVTVLGTRFSVRRYGQDVRVAVVEGRVRVEALRGDASVPAKAITPHVITGGDEIEARGPSTIVAPRSEARVEAALSWRDGLLTFDQTALGDAAEEFNRYNHVKLVVTDQAAAGIRIGGVFKAENADAFAHLLQSAYGLKVERGQDEIRISS